GRVVLELESIHQGGPAGDLATRAVPGESIQVQGRPFRKRTSWRAVHGVRREFRKAFAGMGSGGQYALGQIPGDPAEGRAGGRPESWRSADLLHGPGRRLAEGRCEVR